jgi:hypothetical protein
MEIQQPIPHWNNFTVPDLKDILKHCSALEKLGIAQDQEMMLSIQRDIDMREKKSGRHVRSGSKPKKIEQQAVKQNHEKTNKIIRKTTRYAKQQPQDYLLAQNV